MKQFPRMLLAAAVVLGGAPAVAFPAPEDPTALFTQADVNHDGVVSRMEFLAARAAKFDALDRARCGYITRDDFPRLLRLSSAAKDRVDALFAEADTNRDGRITRWEFDHAPTPIFDRADTNHDGVVDRAELAALRASLGALRSRGAR
ncbi:EF-hand domain-containing protein [Caulobacter sp. KR2-114]|uniref:EF-hand domain-containing protein n=1 Tax=Caulobacter sp. KR2-114 TaxID=3400912 RepID=UPI003C10E391